MTTTDYLKIELQKLRDKDKALRAELAKAEAQNPAEYAPCPRLHEVYLQIIRNDIESNTRTLAVYERSVKR